MLTAILVVAIVAAGVIGVFVGYYAYSSSTPSSSRSVPRYVRISGNITIFIQDFNATPAYLVGIAFTSTNKTLTLLPSSPPFPPCHVTTPFCEAVNMTQISNTTLPPSRVTYDANYSIALPNNNWYSAWVVIRLLDYGNQTTGFIAESLPLYTTNSSISGYNIHCYRPDVNPGLIPSFYALECSPSAYSG